MGKHPSIYKEHGKTYQADTCHSLADATVDGKVKLEALARGSYPGKRLDTNVLPG